MEEVLTAFGIDWHLILVQVVNFGILVAILTYFLYKPILKLLAEREGKIKKGIEDALLAEATKNEAETEKVRILKEAHTEASHIVARATAHGEEKAEELIGNARAKIAKEEELAKSREQELKERTLKESEAEIAKLAVLASEKLLNKELSK